MKANEFVKKFGLDLARRDVAALESGFIKKEDFSEHYGFEILDDLKRLVESHDLVEKHGSLSDAKTELKKLSILRWIDPKTECLREAIADVESCMEGV